MKRATLVMLLDLLAGKNPKTIVPNKAKNKRNFKISLILLITILSLMSLLPA